MIEHRDSSKDIEFFSTLGDIKYKNYDLVLESGLDTTFFLAVYTDAIASEEDELPNSDGDRRGWWGDELLGLSTGSKIWVYSERGKLTIENIENIRTEMINAVTTQMINTGMIESITVTYEKLVDGVTWDVAMYRGTSTNVFLQYSQLWDGQIAKITKTEG